MANPIGWCEDTWVPYTGCDKVSPGCENCYALIMSNRLSGMVATKQFYAPAIEKTKGGKINWTGVLTENTSQLGKPLATKKPTVFFLSSMSDIFHKSLTFSMIDDIFDIMRRCPQHTFKVLTKRAKEMYEYFEWKKAGNGYEFNVWPLQNVQLGISAENQKYLDERLLFLLQCPSAVRFLSCEPLLGQINIPFIELAPKEWGYGYTIYGNLIHQVIVGGESGLGARPMRPDWVRNMQGRCEDMGVSFWFKQWGEWAPADQVASSDLSLEKKAAVKTHVFDADGCQKLTIVARVGTKAAGHLLDGLEYFEQPKR